MKVISFTNQKGGVGKTSLSIFVSQILADLGKKVLLVDMDAQANLSSFFFGDGIYDFKRTVLELIIDPDMPISLVRQTTHNGNIDVVPSSFELVSLDVKLAGEEDSQFYLREKLFDSTDANEYDYVIIDCPPHLGKPNRLALVASDACVIPISCQKWALTGTVRVEAILRDIQKRANPNLKFLGMVINVFKNRKIEKDLNEMLRKKFKEEIFTTEIPDRVAFAEAVNPELKAELKKDSQEYKILLELTQEIIHRVQEN